MGFSYGYGPTGRPRLACDHCPTVGGVRKRKCPFGYCPSAALCNVCYKALRASGEWEAGHSGCEAGHAAYVAKEKAKADMLAAGKLLRCSAMNVGGGKVHVLFQNKDGGCTGFYMTEGTYRAIPLGTNATPEDFALLGTLSPAPADYVR